MGSQLIGELRQSLQDCGTREHLCSQFSFASRLPARQVLEFGRVGTRNQDAVFKAGGL